MITDQGRWDDRDYYDEHFYKSKQSTTPILKYGRGTLLRFIEMNQLFCNRVKALKYAVEDVLLLCNGDISKC